MVEKVALPIQDGVADAQNGLLALLDVLDELDGRLVAFLDVVADVLLRHVAAQQPAIGGIQAQLRDFLVVHQDQVFVALLDESHVRLDQPGLDFVVAQTGTRIEGADEVHGRHHGFQRPAHDLGNFLVVLVLQRVQMLIDEHDRIVQRFQFRHMSAVAVLAMDALQVVQLRQQAFAQVARAHADGIHLLYQVDGFAQGVTTERNTRGSAARRDQGRTRNLGDSALRIRGSALADLSTRHAARGQNSSSATATLASAISNSASSGDSSETGDAVSDSIVSGAVISAVSARPQAAEGL